MRHDVLSRLVEIEDAVLPAAQIPRAASYARAGSNLAHAQRLRCGRLPPRVLRRVIP
jgi:hypothetical protein